MQNILILIQKTLLLINHEGLFVCGTQNPCARSPINFLYDLFSLITLKKNLCQPCISSNKDLSGKWLACEEGENLFSMPFLLSLILISCNIYIWLINFSSPAIKKKKKMNCNLVYMGPHASNVPDTNCVCVARLFACWNVDQPNKNIELQKMLFCVHSCGGGVHFLSF